MSHYKIKEFSDLSLNELYEILKLRQDIFVIEQQDPYNDLDNIDQKSIHLFYQENDNIVSYARIIPPSNSNSNAVIGRIVVDINYRNKGLGKKIIKESIDFCHNSYPNSQIKISAQQNLAKFYETLGFKQCSEPYYDSKIIHIDMIL